MLKQIKYFQTVVRCGSFTKAAEECYISQSAIPQQIQALEQDLGKAPCESYLGATGLVLHEIRYHLAHV